MGLLSRADIEARSDEIFKQGTFDPAGLRPAVYDLRVEIDGDARDPTGMLSGESLILEKGQGAVLRTYEVVSMPWNLAGNLGVKHGQASRGLFVSGGLFVDPGFGWAEAEDGPPVPAGDHLRFLATNLGSEPIAIKLGARGEYVVGIQFIEVEPPVDRIPVAGVPIDDARGLAFFEDLQTLRSESREMSEAIQRTETATDRVVVFGVFLVSATIIGAIVAFVLALLGSGDLAAHTVRALNELDPGRPWTVALMVSLIVLAIACTAWMALAVQRMFLDVWSHRSSADAAKPEGDS